MKLWIKRAGTALLGLVVVWLGLMWSHWLPRPSAEQASALAQMRAPMAQAKGERNAFGLFWQLDYDIPEAERAQVLAEDVAALDGWRPGQDLEALASRARGRYPSRVAKDAPPLPPCEADCLAQVRADPEPWRAALAARQSRLAELGQLAHYDHLRTPFKMSLYSPIPAFQGTGDLQIAAAALAFADGQTEAALSGLCRDLGQWRRLKGRSDLLLSEMISLAWLRNGGRLYADMRAELAADQPLPAACVEAFALPRPEQRLGCDVFRGEFALLDNSLTPEFMVAAEAGEGLKGHAMTWGLRWLLNHEATLATVAPAYADMCTLAALPKAQWSTALPERADGCRWSEAMFNPFGCVLVDIAVPSWADYLLRDRDGEGQLRLLALADWLARQPDPAAAFAERPASFREFEHAVRFENGELSIDLLKPRDAKTPQWRIPLPGSRLPPAPVDQDGGTGSST